MSTPIGDQAARHLIRHGVLSVDAIERVWRELTHHKSPSPYDHHDAAQQRITAQPEGINVSMLDALRTEVQAAEDKAAEVYNHAKTVIEQHLPGIEAAVTAVENEPFVKAYLGSTLAVPEHLVSLALDFLGKLVSVNSVAPAAAPVAADPAAPAATDPAAAPQPTA